MKRSGSIRRVSMKRYDSCSRVSRSRREGAGVRIPYTFPLTHRLPCIVLRAAFWTCRGLGKSLRIMTAFGIYDLVWDWAFGLFLGSEGIKYLFLSLFAFQRCCLDSIACGACSASIPVSFVRCTFNQCTALLSILESHFLYASSTRSKSLDTH